MTPGIGEPSPVISVMEKLVNTAPGLSQKKARAIRTIGALRPDEMAFKSRKPSIRKCVLANKKASL